MNDICDSYELYKWLANTAENMMLYCCKWTVLESDLLLDCKTKEEALSFIEDFVNEDK